MPQASGRADGVTSVRVVSVFAAGFRVKVCLVGAFFAAGFRAKDYGFEKMGLLLAATRLFDVDWGDARTAAGIRRKAPAEAAALIAADAAEEKAAAAAAAEDPAWRKVGTQRATWRVT